MRRFSANLGFLFVHLPLVERIGAAAAAGTTAVEMHWPYDVPARDVKAALARSNIRMLALNTPVGDAAAGDFGLAALPGREPEFRQAFDTALSYGAEIGAKRSTAWRAWCRRHNTPPPRERSSRTSNSRPTRQSGPR